jgi:hypothetical protein
MVIIRDTNGGQNLSIKTHNEFFERVEQFIYEGTNQNSIHEELKSGNAWYNTVLNILSSISLYKNMGVKLGRKH